MKKPENSKRSETRLTQGGQKKLEEKISTIGGIQQKKNPATWIEKKNSGKKDGKKGGLPNSVIKKEKISGQGLKRKPHLWGTRVGLVKHDQAVDVHGGKENSKGVKEQRKRRTGTNR